jgi:nucleobase transporter 1/2
VGLLGIALYWKQQQQQSITSSDAQSTAPFREIMREIQGAIIATGVAQTLLGYSGLFGLLSRFLSPVSVASQILVLGLAVFNGNALEGVLKCPEVGIVQIALVILCSQYLPSLAKLHRRLAWLGGCDTFSVLAPTVTTWLIALTITKTGAFTSNAAQAYGSTDSSFGSLIVHETAWFSFPKLFPYGSPKFLWPSIMVMSAATLSSSIESLGAYNAVARVSGAPIPESGVINRGIGIEGVGVLLSAIFSGGLVGLASSNSSTTGVMGITKVGSRRVVQIAGLMLVLLGLVSKLGVALVSSMPLAMYFGTLCCTSGLISSVGISIGQMAKLNSHRNIFIIGFAIFNGLSVQKYFPHVSSQPVVDEALTTSRGLLLETKSLLFNIVASVLFNPPCLTLILAVFLDSTVPSGTYEERGLHVWTSRSRSNSTSNKANDRYEQVYFLPFGWGKKILLVGVLALGEY